MTRCRFFLRLALPLLLLCAALAPTPALAAQSGDFYVYVNAPDGQGVNLRAGPGTEYNKVLPSPIPMYTRLYIDQTEVSAKGYLWGSTTYDGQSGWISLTETTVYDPSPSVGYYVYVNAPDGQGVNLRAGPSTDYGKVLASPIPMYTRLYIDEITDSKYGYPWGHTTYGGQAGWVSLTETTTYDPTPSASSGPRYIDAGYGAWTDLYVYINDPDVNLRAGPGTDYWKVRKDPIPIYTRVHVVSTAYSAYGNLWGYTSYTENGWTYSGWIYLPDTTAYDPRPVAQTQPAAPLPATEPETEDVIPLEENRNVTQETGEPADENTAGDASETSGDASGTETEPAVSAASTDSDAGGGRSMLLPLLIGVCVLCALLGALIALVLSRRN